jgi:DNA-binding transcriptional MerR regulator
MAKSPDAFRTISEVADWLGIQAHVLRFWESKFTQVKPIKRAGGRRYYRPGDMQLLGGIKKLLHDDGLTIKGVQKILREEGMNHVAAMSAPLDELTASQIDDTPETAAPPPPAAAVEPETGVVLSFEPAAEKNVKNDPEAIEEEQDFTSEPADDAGEAAPSAAASAPDAPAEDEQASAAPEAPPAPAPEAAPDTPAAAPQGAPEPDGIEARPAEDPAPIPEAPMAEDVEDAEDESAAEEPVAIRQADAPGAAPETEAREPEAPAAEERQALPAFLRRPLESTPADPSDNPPPPASGESDAPAAEADGPQATPEAPAEDTPPAPRPRVLPDLVLTAEQDFDAIPAVLTTAYRLRSLNRDKLDRIEPLVARLTKLRDSMAASRGNGGGPRANG